MPQQKGVKRQAKVAKRKTKMKAAAKLANLKKTARQAQAAEEKQEEG